MRSALSHGHRGPLGRADRLPALLAAPPSERSGLLRRCRITSGPRWQQRGERRVYSGRLSRDEIERYEIDVRLVAKPTPIAEGAVALRRDARHRGLGDDFRQNLRVEEEGELLQDTFIGEQTLVANVRDRGLVVVTSCSHRGIVGICRNAVRFTGIPKVHAVIGGFHLSGLDEARITRVVDALSRPRRGAHRPAALHRHRGHRRSHATAARAVHRQLGRHDVRVRGTLEQEDRL